jgi:hypothetical protein
LYKATFFSVFGSVQKAAVIRRHLFDLGGVVLLDRPQALFYSPRFFSGQFIDDKNPEKDHHDFISVLDPPIIFGYSNFMEEIVELGVVRSSARFVVHDRERAFITVHRSNCKVHKRRNRKHHQHVNIARQPPKAEKSGNEMMNEQYKIAFAAPVSVD